MMSGVCSISKEQIRIEGGFGPIEATQGAVELEIRPMTVFIGPQGTGKSLVSQLLYFFRDAEYLLARYAGQEGPDSAVRKVIEGVRAGELTNRALASFLTTSNVRVHYEGQYKNGATDSKLARSISIYQANRRIRPLQPFAKQVDSWLQHWISDLSAAGEVESSALFVPAERTFYSRFINSNPQILGNKALPLTMREFARALGEAADTHQLWQDGSASRPTEANEIENMVQDTLSGKATYSRQGRYARKWQWVPKTSGQPIEIELASSGQMGSWPLVFTSQAMFGWSAARRPLFLHIEEPETHLHPAAQIAIMKMLAFLVNHGFHLVITTHSLVVLYALNNLTLAYKQLGNKEAKRVPETHVRLAPDKMAAYLFANGSIKNIVDEGGQIDEGLLGDVLGDLEVQFNRLMTYNILWE